MSSDDTGGESNEADPSQIFREYKDRPIGQAKINNVMLQLENAGLVRTSDISDSQNEGLTAEEKLLSDTYRNYRASRSSNTDDRIESVMVTLTQQHGSGETPDVHVAINTKTEKSRHTEKTLLSHAQRIFSLPSKMVNSVLNAIGLSGERRRAAIPAFALAVAVVVAVPIFKYGPGNKDAGGSIGSIVTYSAPDSLWEAASGISSAIDPSPVTTMAFSANQSLQSRSFNIGRSILQLKAIAADQSVSQATATATLSKLDAAEWFGMKELPEVSNIKERFDVVPVDSKNGLDAIAGFRKVLLEHQLSDIDIQWVIFGEAIESLELANRLTDKADHGILEEALARFSSVDFIGSLPDIPENTEGLIKRLNKIAVSDAQDPTDRRNISRLIYQISLSVI